MLKRLTRLESLKLTYTHMDPSHVIALSCFTRLKVLDLEASSLVDTYNLANLLYAMPHLASLNLSSFNGFHGMF